MGADEWGLPTLGQIDAMLAFLPIFEREGFVTAGWIVEPGRFLHSEDSLETGAFRSTIHSSGFYGLGKQLSGAREHAWFTRTGSSV